MAEVHQIYVTHCTHGSSALERREGDLAGRMLGYSARAGSLEAVELRRYYRLIERYVYYYLPRDTPAEDKLSLTAASAPRRLIFLPATGGLQLVGQVCYRPTDTQGRPGSYFAHVLWQECREGTPAWSPAECLRLWNAQGWAQEDRDEIPFLLPTLSSIDDVLQGHRPAIDDRVLRSFLTAEGPASLDDPARVIPPRWRDAPPVLRQQLFQQVFEAVLQHGLHERQGVLLLAEAELAALLLYGVTRLVPLGELSRTISFSTFEPNPDRLCTMLSATQFRDPKAVDLRPETYRGPGPTVINTFAPRQEAGQPSTPYVGWIVQRLLGEGWESADLVLSHLARCEPRSVEDLHHAAQADRCATMLLAGTAPGGEDWRRGFAAEYLGHALRHGLERLAHDPAALQRLAGTPAQVPLIDLAGTQRDAECRPAVVHLLRNLPDGWIGDVCRLGRVTREDKLALLLRYVSAHGQWPCEADWIWEPSRSDASFLPDLLGHLDSGVAAQLYRQTAIEHHPAFLLALLAAGRQKGSRLPALSHVIRMIDDDNLVELFLDHAEIRENYPADEPVLSERLQKLVLGLPFPAAGFARRLALILECQARLGDERLATVARHWEACRRQIVVLGRLQTQAVSVTRRRPWAQIESAFRTAVEAAHAAMPEDLRDDARPGAMKLNWLRQLGPALLGGAELLGPGPWRHAALWEKARRYFAYGRWPAESLAQLRPTRSRLRSQVMVLGSVALGFLVLIAVALYQEDASNRPAAQVPSEVFNAASSPSVAPVRHDPDGDTTPASTPQTASSAAASKPVPEAGSAVGPPATGESQPENTATRASLPIEVVAETPATTGMATKPEPAKPMATETSAAARPVAMGFDPDYSVREGPSGLGSDSGTKAILTLTLRRPTGEVIKPNSTDSDGFRVVWYLRKESADRPPTMDRVGGVSEFDPVRLDRNVSAVWFHLEFFASEAGMPTDHPTLLAKSATKRLEPESGLRYQITYRLTEQQIRALQSRRPMTGPQEF